MANDKKPSTSARPGLFPRSYVIERIKARIGTIERDRGGARRAAAELNRRRQADRATLEVSLGEWHRSISHLHTAYAAALSKASTPEQVEAARVKFIEKREALGAEPKIGRKAEIRGAEPLRWVDIHGDDETNAIKRQAQAEQAAEKERRDLEHALAYLQDTPVEMFSVTGLKQLGLLEAIRFRL